ncbi:MAG: transposase family protein, partial [Planctomycetaceae bacterium]|nr:transposase family protein [Planctomycetaceae bacterium]
MSNPVSCLADAFRTISDPRSKQGTNLPFTGLLGLVFLGLLAGQNYFAHIYRWVANHWSELQTPLGFKKDKPPHATTLSRFLARIQLRDLQEAFVIVLSQVLKEQPLIASVDGKVSKQIL